MSGIGAGFTTGYAGPLKAETEMAEIGLLNSEKNRLGSAWGECCQKRPAKKYLTSFWYSGLKVNSPIERTYTRYGNVIAIAKKRPGEQR
jgi:hypothetical protein